MPASLLQAAKSADEQISAIKAAFGAPGDYGYESREGKALFALFQCQAELHGAIKDSPIMKAWEEYTASPEFANSKRWAEVVAVSSSGGKEDRQFIVHPHLEGSLWAAFTAGIRAGRVLPLGA